MQAERDRPFIAVDIGRQGWIVSFLRRLPNSGTMESQSPPKAHSQPPPQQHAALRRALSAP